MEIQKLRELIKSVQNEIKDLTMEEAVVFFEEVMVDRFTGIPAIIIAHDCLAMGAKKAVVTVKENGCNLTFVAPRNGALKLDKPEEHEDD